MERLLGITEQWCEGNHLEARAAAAAVAEPRLLQDKRFAPRVLALFHRITESVASARDRRIESFRALRQALPYCWSVAEAAYPQQGKAAFQRWLSTTDPDVRLILRENLKKKRLMRIHSDWAREMLLLVTQK